MEFKGTKELNLAIKPFEELFKQASALNPCPVNIDCQISMRDLRDLIYSFDDMNKPTSGSILEAYCNAWLASFSADNPYHTVRMSEDDKKHIQAGLSAAILKATGG